MGKFTNGIQEVSFGDIGTDGAIATSFTPLGYTAEGSFKINQEEGQKNEFMVEETDLPVFVTEKPGALNFEFELADPDADSMIKVFGGSKQGTTYQPPDKQVSVEKSFRVKPNQGYGFDVTRAKVTGTFSSDYGRDAILKVKVSVKVLAPTKVGAKKFTMPYYAPAG